MTDKLILGRYIPYDSWIHRLDARSKLLTAILYITFLFIANNWLSYFLLIAFAGLAIYLSNLSVTYFIKGIRPMLVLITFTALLQVLFTPGAQTIFSFGLISISQQGLIRGVFIFWRFILIIVISTLLTLTTEALEIADAIEFYLSPLKRFNFPVAETTMMLSISMRFIPTMMDEAEIIMNAQKSRGVSFGEGNILERIKSYIPILIPLFVNSYDRAPQLATAMEARAYQGGANRTKYRQLIWHTQDTILMFVNVFLILLILLVNK